MLARVEKGETFSRWREKGAPTQNLARAHPCLTGVIYIYIYRGGMRRVSRWILPRKFLLTVGQPFNISSRWLSSPKIDGSVLGG